jgi:hypothetical protein
MSKIHIANFRDSDRATVRAWADLDLGDVIRIVDDGVGGRAALPVTALGHLVTGRYAVAMKFSADPEAVQESTVDDDSGASLGSRIVSISSGDFIVACGPGAILEYPEEELDASVTTSTVDAGDFLAIKSSSSKFCTQASGDITAKVVGQVHSTFGTRILVRVLAVPTTP